MITYKNLRCGQRTIIQVGPLQIVVATPVMAGWRKMSHANLARCARVDYVYVGANYDDFVNRGREWQRITL